jgi:hypothetical protein
VRRERLYVHGLCDFFKPDPPIVLFFFHARSSYCFIEAHNFPQTRARGGGNYDADGADVGGKTSTEMVRLASSVSATSSRQEGSVKSIVPSLYSEQQDILDCYTIP